MLEDETIPQGIVSSVYGKGADMGKLDGKKIAFLAADGVEQSELTEPWKAVEQAGGKPELVSLEEGEIQGVESEIEKRDTFKVDRLVADVEASDYDGLVLPGGVMNPDKLRADEHAVEFVRQFVEAGKPVGAICHGPWTLVEAGVVDGREMTSYPSIQTDLKNAGANWVDREVVVDNGLVTSRSPDDLEAFCSKVVEEMCEGVHA
jgi:protease I